MKKYKVLLFDFDDTLFDFSASEKIALSRTFEHYGIPDTDELHQMYIEENLAYWRGFEKGIYKNESDSVVRFKNLTERIGRTDIDYTEMCTYYIDELSTTAFPIENSPELLKSLSEKYDIYIVTNALKRVNDKRSAIGGILPYIKGRFISEQIGISKPNKGFFDYCFDKIGLPPSQALLIGDSLVSDISGGSEYGIDTCWFNQKEKPNTLSVPVTYEIHSLWELEDFLK